MLFHLAEREDQMNAPFPKCVFHPKPDQRAHTRFPVAIPVITQADATKRSASVLNITVDGAMIRTSSSLPIGSSVVINFGSTSVVAKVIWQRPDGEGGVKFERSLSAAELQVLSCRNSLHVVLPSLRFARKSSLARSARNPI
jgi:hypothetical protein